MPQIVRIVCRLVVTLLFRFRVKGHIEALETPGPAILMPNHVSWLDSLLVWLVTSEGWRFVASGEVAQKNRFLARLIRSRNSFLVDPANPFALREVARHLQAGGRIILFPEGSLSHSGQLRKFFDGLGLLLARSQATVIPCYIRGAERTLLARQKGHKRFWTRVELHLGAPRRPPLAAPDARPAEVRKRNTNWARKLMLEMQLSIELGSAPARLEEAVLLMARRHSRQPILEDVTGRRLDYKTLAVGSLALANVARNRLGDRARVALLLPNSCGFALALIALLRLRKVPAILNFSSGTASMLTCARLAEADTIITSRAFVAATGLDLVPLLSAGMNLLYLEDLREKVGVWEKLAALARWRFLRAAQESGPSPAAVVLFTSGSEGTPKGVELSHRNIMANILQLTLANDLVDEDRVLNALPTFHCFGLTVGLLLPLVRGFWSFQYPSPLHYRTIPALIYDRSCTVFLATSTFLAGYARRAHPYDFHSLRRVFAGAEKLQESVATTWAFVHGVRVLEGYGATECSPCISMNSALEPRQGSVGRLLPGIEVRIEPIEGVARGGRLFVNGPNVMKGYLNAKANDAFRSLEGWYDTGDVARLDEDGFLFIEGRMKRFAKVAGEMVSLPAIEEALDRALGEKRRCAVVAIPDVRRGEALVAATADRSLSLEEVMTIVREAGLPAIAFPRELRRLPELPVLPTGKTDYVTLSRMVAADPGS